MAASKANQYLKQAGLTLVEVLVALAIVSIALTAIVKATAENIRSTTYLQNKSIAMWVGTQVMNEIRVGLLALPDNSDALKQTTVMFDKDWYWHATAEETPNKKIKKITVNVYEKESEDDETPVVSLESYLYGE